jgi:hypothetical protein
MERGDFKRQHGDLGSRIQRTDLGRQTRPAPPAYERQGFGSGTTRLVQHVIRDPGAAASIAPPQSGTVHAPPPPLAPRLPEAPIVVLLTGPESSGLHDSILAMAPFLDEETGDLLHLIAIGNPAFTGPQFDAFLRNLGSTPQASRRDWTLAFQQRPDSHAVVAYETWAAARALGIEANQLPCMVLVKPAASRQVYSLSPLVAVSPEKAAATLLRVLSQVEIHRILAATDSPETARIDRLRQHLETLPYFANNPVSQSDASSPASILEARGLPPEDIDRILHVLHDLEQHPHDPIERGAMGSIGLPPTTVDSYYKKRGCPPSAREGGGVDLARVSYRKAFLREFLLYSWQPR